MADEKQTQEKQTPADRIRAAIAGMDPRSLPEVYALDVLAVAGAIPREKQTDVSRSQIKGCTETVRGLLPHVAAERTVHVQAGDLAHLLEIAGEHAQ